MCGTLGCDVDTIISVILSFIGFIGSIIVGIGGTIGTLIQVMLTFFQAVGIIFGFVTDPGLIIMVVLTCINFYASMGSTRKEVVGRYLEGFKKASVGIVWIFSKMVTLVMGLIQAIIDII